MRRYLFLIPLLMIVFAAPRVAEAQSFCSLSGVEWTRCYDFGASAHGFTAVLEGGTPLGDYDSGWHSVEILFDPGDPSTRNEYVSVRSPSGWSGAAITQARIVYQWTPGPDDGFDSTWASVASATWSRAELEAGAGTITKSVAFTASDSIVVSMYGAQCMSCSTPGSVAGSITIVGLVLGGTGTPPPGEEPSTGSGGGAPADLNLDVTPLYESISAYIPTFLALFAIPGGIVLAVALVRMIVSAISNAIRGASGNG